MTEPAPVFDQSDTQWHVDRKVPIAVIIAIVAQTGGFIWWGAKADERLTTLERRVETSAPQADRLTRVEVNLESIKESLTEIKARLRPR
jgi:hypothetical protein